jgi:vancomycin resistance protein YoaR
MTKEEQKKDKTLSKEKAIVSKKKQPAKGESKAVKKPTTETITVVKKQSKPPLKLSLNEKETKDKLEDTAHPKKYTKELKGFIKEEATKIKEGIDPDKFKQFKKAFKNGLWYFAGIVSVTAILLVIELHSNNRIFPWTKAGSINISYLTPAEAQEKVSVEIQNYLKEPLIFSFEGNSIGLSAEEIGLKIGIEQTLARAPIFEFEKENPVYMAAVLFTQRNTPIDYTIDGDHVIKTLETKFNLSDKRAKNARIVFNEETNNFDVQAEASGTAIDRQKLIESLRKNIDGLSTQTIEISLKEEKPRVNAEELAQEKDRLVALLENPITLNAENESLTLKLAEHLDAVSFEEKSTLKVEGQTAAHPIILKDGEVELAHANPVEINSKIQIALDAEKLASYLDENLISSLEKSVEGANIYKDENGKVVIEGKGRDGKSVPKNRLTEAIALAANNNISEVPVPVVVEHAPLTISDDLKELGIKELLTTGHSAYYGSPANRMFNITFGSEKFNGTLIAPGEEFSFNTLLGPVDAVSGFKPEKVIKKDELVYEYGGGICQVSTTMYRAVLQAGLPITERKPHSWKVSYYGQSMGHGLDSTIYPGVSDLKFINNTPGHILVQAYTEDAEDYFKLYGTSDGRKVELDGPYGGGLTYRWNHTVQMPGEEPVTEEIWSRYKPIPPPKPVAQPKPAAAAPAPAVSGGGIENRF